MKKRTVCILSFLVLITLSSLSWGQERPWDFTLSLGSSSVSGIEPFATSKTSIRQGNGYAIVASRQIHVREFGFGTLETAGYARVSHLLDTTVTSIGGRFGFHPQRNDGILTELRIGIAHPFGDFEGDVIRGRTKYLNQKRTDLIYDIGLGISFAIDPEQRRWIGLDFNHLSTCARCGFLALPESDRQRNPGINLTALTFRQYF